MTKRQPTSVNTLLGSLTAALLIPAASLLLIPAAADADSPSWTSVAAVETVQAVTRDADDSSRVTTIWMAVLDGQGYIRTSRSTRWGDNLERDPNMGLRVGEVEYPLRAVFMEDDALRARVVQAFREKYGWTDGMFQIFRGSSPRIMRLDARPGPP